MNALDTGSGVERDTARTTDGRMSTDMNRTSCMELTMPISTAMRIPVGRSAIVLYHSASTALMASRSYVSWIALRVAK